MPRYISQGGNWATEEKVIAEKEAKKAKEVIVEEKPKVKKVSKKKAKPKSTK